MTKAKKRKAENRQNNVRPLRIMLLSLGCAFLVYALITGIGGPFGIGVIACLSVSLFLILFGTFYRFFGKARAVLIVIYILLALFLLFVIFLGVFGSVDTCDHTEDAIIVLGAAVKGDQPGSALRARLDAALGYLNTNEKAVIVVSGGRGDNEEFSEAQVMKDYLISHGIPEARILSEDKSIDTTDNIVNSEKLLDERFGKDQYRAVIVTTEYHVFRSKIIALKHSLDCSTLHCSSVWYYAPVNYLRECVGIARLIILGR